MSSNSKMMVRVTRFWILLLCGLAFLVGYAAAQSPPDIMPVTAVAKGQHGIGKTVVSGTTIEEFDVEILGVVRGQGPSQSLILVRTSGPLIERTGGIAAGMSGSPVYVDGKLLGAVAYGFDMADHTLGLLTPAEDMVQVLDLAAEMQATAGSANTSAMPVAVALSTSPDQAAQLRASLPADVAVAVPVATPLLINGLSERTMQLLSPALQRWNVQSVPAGKAPTNTHSTSLEPGSAFGVQMVRGDVEMTALGTVTYVDDEGFVGFGHPFLSRGDVNFFVTTAYIHEVVKSLQAPFKMGAPLDVVGHLTQDRGSGVAGFLGGQPDYLNVQVAVNDRSIGRTKQFNAQVIYDESLTVPLLAITLLEALDRALDRIGQGTATVKATVNGPGLPNPVTRDNIFYSSTDISAASLSELIYALQKLLGNDLATVKLHDVSFVVDVENARRTARVEKAVVHTPQVKPGGTVDMEVTIRPFREEPVKMTLRLPVPEDAPEGTVVAGVRGGGYGIPRLLVSEVAAQLEGSGEEEDEEGVENTPSDFAKFLAGLFDADRNYELVAEYYPGDVLAEMEAMQAGAESSKPDAGSKPSVAAKDPNPAKKSGKDAKTALNVSVKDVAPVKVKVATPYFIQGAIQVTFEVVSPTGNTPPAADSNIPEEGSEG